MLVGNIHAKVVWMHNDQPDLIHGEIAALMEFYDSKKEKRNFHLGTISVAKELWPSLLWTKYKVGDLRLPHRYSHIDDAHAAFLKTK